VSRVVSLSAPPTKIHVWTAFKKILPPGDQIFGVQDTIAVHLVNFGGAQRIAAVTTIIGTRVLQSRERESNEQHGDIQ